MTSFPKNKDYPQMTQMIADQGKPDPLICVICVICVICG